MGDLFAAVGWMLIGGALYGGLRAQFESERRARHDARHLAEQEKGRRALGRAAGGVDLSQTADHDPEWRWDRDPYGDPR